MAKRRGTVRSRVRLPTKYKLFHCAKVTREGPHKYNLSKKADERGSQASGTHKLVEEPDKVGGPVLRAGDQSCRGASGRGGSPGGG